MHLTSAICTAILAASAVHAAALPEPFKRAADALAAAEAWCGSQEHGIPCNTKRVADDLIEGELIAKREAESSPEALALAFCGSQQHGIPCNTKRAAEAIAEAHANAEANPMPLPDAEAFAEAWCGSQGHGIPCNTKRAAEAVPEAWCASQQHGIPCNTKREAILRREYSAALALRALLKFPGSNIKIILS